MALRENISNTMQNFGGPNKEYYGIFESAFLIISYINYHSHYRQNTERVKNVLIILIKKHGFNTFYWLSHNYGI